jgi:GcrA cell cycle regulator
MTRWTPERSELAKKLWTETGYSASEIARALGGGISRNGVIGRLHRMGLTGSGEGARKRAADLGVRRTAAALSPTRVYTPRPAHTLRIAGHGTVFEEAPARPATVVIPFREEGPGLRTIMTIRPFGECKWPCGDPADDSFTLCGRAADGTYCEAHHARAYQPAQAKKRAGGAELARSLRRFIA